MSALALVVLIASAPLTEDPDYTTAIQLYQNVEFEQALFRFQSAAIKPGLNDAERAELFLWIGLCYGNIGDLESAERQFRDGLKLFPSAPLPQPNTSPIIIDLFKRVKDEVNKAAAATPADPAPPDKAPDDAPDSTTTGDAGGDPTDSDAATGEGGGLPWLLMGGGGVAAAGVVLLVAAGATAGASYVVFSQGLALGDDPTVYGSDIKSLELMANVLLGSAAGMAALGLLVVVAGGATAGASFALE
jgi:tetratricopeptide (TPR) repeat protein